MVLEAIVTIVVELIKTPITDYVVSPVKRHLRYAFECDSQVQNLQEVVGQLKNKKERLENSVAEAARSGEEIYRNVTTWLNNSETGIGEAEQLIQGRDEAKQARCIGACPNLKTRYQLSKKADKKASMISTLVREAEGLNLISFRPPLEPIVEPSVYAQEALTSRVQILEKIMNALKDPNLKTIGVYGMGGVGKTTLAKEVQAKAMQEKMFDNVVLVAVSQTPELRRIQTEIADFLGLRFDVEELPGRASQLYLRLKKSRVLIILDDLWQKVDLNSVGIPSRDSSKNCKLFLTSRRRDVLRNDMGAQKEFSLGTLEDGEAWKLFKTIAPKSIDPQFHATATEVSKKCAGLPLLIIIVAQDLRNKELYEWDDMLKQLSVTGNEDIYERVHKVLEKSFEKLPGEEVKSLFLLCSMFAQSNIQLQMLLIFSMGLGIFKHRVSIQEARNRLLTLINKLKADCLLLDGDKDGFVKMHDVVRDSAISIASRLQHAFVGFGQVSLWDEPSQNCEKISLPYCDVHELPGDLECPQADLFLLFTEDLCLEFPDSFFEGFRKLKVLGVTGMRLGSLPSSLGLLPNLHTLSLQRCRLNSVAVVGELKQLQFLSLVGSKIVELPREIEELTRLKLLDMSNCTMLQIIHANVLSKLCLLEEIYMLNSFDRWDTKDNASLMELECLPKLSTLEIQIVNPKLIPRGFRFFDGLQLDSFKISIGDEWSWDEKYGKSKKLNLKLESSFQLEHRIEGFLRVVEDISLDGAWGINFDLKDFPQLKHLHIQNNSCNIQHLIKPNVRVSCDSQLAAGSFGKLQSLKVTHCHKLKVLLLASSANCMSQLQEMELDCCDSVEAIVSASIEDGQYNNEVIEFTQLNSLKLVNLPDLRCFCKSRPGTAQTNLLFNEMASFPNLKSLVVRNCKKLNYIFNTSMVKCLGQLKKLAIHDCKSLEEIMVIRKSEELEERIDKIAFLKLGNLHLDYLPNLRRFFCGHVLEFPSLKTLTINSCPAMENFVSKYSSDSSKNGSDEYFFNELVTLSSLETLDVFGMDNFRYLWDDKFMIGNSFCKLTSLAVRRCSKLRIIFPLNVYRRFHRLETLNVFHCGDVEEIYQYEGVNLEDNNIVQTFFLRDLEIWGLQSLKHIWSKDSRRAYTYGSLQLVFVRECEDLKHVFPESIASDLYQLQRLHVSLCGVEMIIAKKSKGCPSSFEFPELTSIKLAQLDEMRCICEGLYALELPKLKSLELHDCNELTKFGSKICSYDGEDKNGTDKIPVTKSIPFAEKFIPNLEELTIDDQGFNAIHQSGLFPDEFFSNLKKVTVTSIEEESVQFLSGFLKRLNSMETLVLKWGSFYLESLFDDEKAVGEKHHSRLKHLEFHDLYGLKYIVKKESPLNSILQHLQTLLVCDSYLMAIAPSSTSFHNLTALNLCGCSRMTKLVTGSTAKTLVQLVQMRVELCNSIEEIIATDEHCTKHDVINFNKLKCLELRDLRKITSFCSGHYTFNFPLLQEVKVKECPRMKNFCCGIVSTPRLRGILFDDEQQWEGDINATIACHLRQWVGVHFEEWKIFQNVESVEVVKDAFSSKVISANQLQFLLRLEKIIGRDCELMQVVFDLEGLCVEDGYVGMLPRLEELHLVNLPRLSKVCSKPPAGVLEFNKLTVLKIDNCGGMEYACTWSMAACLVQLRTIELRNCELMERIIKGEEADGEATVTLRSLTTVVLECLPKFLSFYSGIGDLECPSLEKISMRECPSVQAFISRLPREEGKKAQNILFCHKVLPSLNKLSLDMKSLVAILRVKLPTNFFLNVKKLVLPYCSVKTAGSCVHLVHFLSRLPSLDKLEIHTSSMEGLFKFEPLNNFEEAMTLPRITSLKLKSVADVKHIWWFVPLFQYLRTLEVRECGELINLALSSSSFQNLTALEVYGCSQVISLITPSVAKSMVKLETLSVKRCGMLKEIVGNDNDGTIDVVCTKMKTLDLLGLPSLQSFSSGHCDFQFPCLENVFLISCPNLKFFSAGTVNAPKLYDVKHGPTYARMRSCWEGDLSATIQQLYMNMIGFADIDRVELTIFPLLKEFWVDRRPLKCLTKVELLVVDNIASILNAISQYQLPHLKSLEVLKVAKCEAVEQVFDLEGLDDYGCRSKLLKNLNQLLLVDLPCLRHVWSKDPQRILSFRNLQLLEVQNCGKLTYIFDLSMALRLPRLERVEVKNCSLVKHIIVKAKEETMQECRTIFPSLQSISLQHLTSLSSFYSTNEFLKCPSLKMIQVVECPNVKLFLSTFSSEQDSSVDVEEREQQISCKDHDSQPAFLGNQIAVPELKELKVEWNSLEHIFNDDNRLEFLSRLKLIELVGLPGDHGSLPPNFLQFFPKLEKLSLSDSLIEEINLHELSSLEGDDHGSLTLLTKLKFSKLPELKHLVCDEFSRVAILQNLEGLEVDECSRLRTLVPLSVSFQNLTNLQVSNCDGMINLVTSSTARSLVQLKKMELKECKMMEEIIAVGSDEHEIRFSQLEYLELVDMPCLESFCSGKFDLSFPSLEEVVVIGCPSMKKFASSVTPKLKKVNTGRCEYEWEWEGNLNNTIQALHEEQEAEQSLKVRDRRD